MKRPRPRDPIIPGDAQDRTGTRGILRRAVADIRRRWDGLQREALAIFDRIHIVQPLALNDAAELPPRTMYAMTPDELAAVSQALRDALARWVASGREPAHAFWWSTYLEDSARLGVAQAVANLSAISTAYAGATQLQDVLFSEGYRNRVAMAQIKSYDHWTGLAEEQRATLSRVIGHAVADGQNPRVARKAIIEALDVGKSRAMGYAQTDITDTLRQARWAEDERASEDLGLRLAELWTSALIPTTRATHAARHGKAYSVAECRAFYAKDGNRYRCHCSQTTCLLDEDGRPILTDTLKASMKKERAAWDREQAKRKP